MAGSRSMILFALAVLVVCLSAGIAIGGTGSVSFQYLSPEEVRSRIESSAPMTLLDIQVEGEYERHHIRGSLATHAYPVKTDEDRAKIDRVVPQLKPGKDSIVIICPRGGGGAKRTYEYLVSLGFDSSRLFILERGQGGWPYPDLLGSR